MGWTKRQFVEQAFDEIGYASYAYDLTEEQIQVAKYRLDSMMATWNGRGITLGYPLQTNQVTDDLDSATDVPDYAIEAIYTNLAIRVSGSVGKTVPSETRKVARQGFRILVLRSDKAKEMQYPETLPRGAGNKPYVYDRDYFPKPDENLEIFDGDGTLDI